MSDSDSQDDRSKSARASSKHKNARPSSKDKEADSARGKRESHNKDTGTSKRARVESKSDSGSDSDTRGRVLDLEHALDSNDKIYFKMFKQIEKKHEIFEKDLSRTKNTLRAVHRELTRCDLRIMNVSRSWFTFEGFLPLGLNVASIVEMDNGDLRDGRAAFRQIISEGLGFDLATTDAICHKNSLKCAMWLQQRSRARGGGRGGAGAGLENFALIVKLTNEDNMISILKAKSKERFRDFKLGCVKPVGIDRNYTAEDKWDRNRSFEVARALCEKKGLTLKKDVKMKGKAFEALGVTRTYHQWIVMENLTVDPAKMGEGWTPPPSDQPSTSA